ncbi:MAG: hypothetical protein ACKOAS_01955, partial [Verrucomicrobiota bacterium]
LVDTPVFKKKHLPAMLAKAMEIAGSRKDSLIQSAKQKATDQFNIELERLRDLAGLGHPVSAAEIEALESSKTSLLSALAEAVLRLDALKLVLRTSPR